MATSAMAELIEQLRGTALSRDGAGSTDGQLLEAYLNRRDEAALAALVQRHAPMVWGVCRRVLANYHEAEDAFQATFLVLVRKATSVRRKEMVANWLYGVAHQTALKARATVGTRKRREAQVVMMPEPAVAEPAQWDELLPILDEEVSRLPANYRAAVVLCELEGKTRKEAARQLGVPEGTVAGWVARARAMLSKRFCRRGVMFSGGSVVMALSASAPLALVASTVKAASLFAAGNAAAPGLISAQVAALTEGMAKTMFVTKFKTGLAVALVVAALAGAAGLIYTTQAAEQPKAKEEQPAARKDQKKGEENPKDSAARFRIPAGNRSPVPRSSPRESTATGRRSRQRPTTRAASPSNASRSSKNSQPPRPSSPQKTASPPRAATRYPASGR